MNKYTVLLLLPDFIAGNFGMDTYQAHVEAVDETEAAKIARAEFIHVEEMDAEPGSSGIDDPDDLFILAMYEGHLNDISGRVKR